MENAVTQVLEQQIANVEVAIEQKQNRSRRFISENS